MPMRAIARIQTAACGNKVLAFFALFASVLLVHFSSTSTTRRPFHSPRVSKRHGIGAGEGSSELASALRRKGDGRAAVAIIRVVGSAGGGDDEKNDPADTQPDRHPDVRYLVQIKSHDYPIEAFRGTVCLLGGNANVHDETPLDTLKRELNEELHRPYWVDAIDAANVIDDSSAQTAARLAEKPSFANSTASSPPAPGTVRYLGTTLHFQGADLIDNPAPYAFACALYEITLRPDQLPPGVIHPRGATVEEGRAVLLDEDQLVRHSKFAWGYEHTMEEYFGRTIENKQTGTSVTDMNDRTWEEMTWTPSK